MSVTHKEVFTCDGCGALDNHELLQKVRLPKNWIYIEITGSSGWLECFHLCSKCSEKLEWLAIMKEGEE